MFLRILGYFGLTCLIFTATFLMLDKDLAGDITIALSAGISVLVTLLVVQLRFVTSKIRVKSQKPPEVDATRVAGLLKEIQKSKASSTKQQVQPAPAPAIERSSDVSETLDSSVFSKFQKNLNQQTTATDTPVVEADDEVVVSLSSQKKNFKVKGQNPYAKKAESGVSASERDALLAGNDAGETAAEVTLSTPPKKPAPPKKAPAEKAPSAIVPAQVAEKGVKPVGSKGDPLEGVPTEPIGELFSEITEEEGPARIGKMIQPKKRQKGVGSKPPMAAQEMLTAADLELPPSEKKKDHIDLLHAAEDKIKAEKPAEGLETVEVLLAGIEGKEEPETQLDAYLLKANAEFELEKFAEHQKSFEKIFKQFIPKTDPEFLPTLERVMDQYIRAGHQRHAIHFFFTALKEYQVGGDLKRMDVTYYHIEEAYRALEDSASLVKTYQNHLAIKKQRDDLVGQLPILDHLGKLLYDQGDQEGSKSCYEQAIHIQEQEA